MTPEERSAVALEKIVELLDRLCPAPVLPNYPDKPWGREHLTYLDEEELLRQEQEAARLKELGRKPNDS